MLLDKTFSSTRAIGISLKKEGIARVKNGGRMSESEVDKVFGLTGIPPAELNICFLTGSEFFHDFQKEKKYITQLASQGCKIKVLLCNPLNSQLKELWKGTDFTEKYPKSVPVSVAKHYYDRINGENTFESYLEREYYMIHSDWFKNCYNINDYIDSLKKHGDYYYEIRHVLYLLEDEEFVPKKARDNIEIRFYNDEFQMSFFIAKYTKPNYTWLAHTTLNAPIRVATEAVSITMEKSEMESPTYFDDLQRSFDYLWNRYESSAFTRLEDY